MTNISKWFQEEFLDELMEEAWISSEEASLIKEDLRPILQERILLYIFRELNDEQVTKTATLLQEEKYEELTNYLKWIIPDFEEFLYEIYAQFEDEYLEHFKK